MIFVVLALAGTLHCLKARADFYVPARGEVLAGNRKFASGRYKEAVDHYAKAALKSPSSAEVAYNTGAALYKSSEYDQAIGYFEKALLTDDDDFRQSVHFNLGNALYRSALTSEQTDPKVALNGFEQAVSSYESALAIDSEDIQARTNMEFVRKEIERVRQKQQQQQSGSRQDKNSSQKEQSQESRGQSGSGQNSPPEEKSSEKNQQPGEQPGNDEFRADGSRDEEQEQKQASSGNQTSGEQQKATHMSGDSDKPSGEQNAEDAQQLSRQEAEGMLEDLEQSELPRGMLNFIRKSRDHATVQKDW
jgi:Ca-activated chloride channel family protein